MVPVGFVETVAQHEASVAVAVVRRNPFAEGGEELERAWSEITFPGELSVVNAFHLSGMPVVPTIGCGVTHKVECGGNGCIGCSSKSERGCLNFALANYVGGDTGIELLALICYSAELVEQQGVEVFLANRPGIGLRLLIDGRIGIGKARSCGCNLEGITDTVAGTIVGACGPAEGDSLTRMESFVEHVGRLEGREGQCVVTLVELHIVIVGTCGKGKTAENEGRDIVERLFHRGECF